MGHCGHVDKGDPPQGEGGSAHVPVLEVYGSPLVYVLAGNGHLDVNLAPRQSDNQRIVIPLQCWHPRPFLSESEISAPPFTCGALSETFYLEKGRFQ